MRLATSERAEHYRGKSIVRTNGRSGAGLTGRERKGNYDDRRVDEALVRLLQSEHHHNRKRSVDAHLAL